MSKAAECVLFFIMILISVTSILIAEDLDQNGCPDARNSEFNLAGEPFCCSVGVSGFSRSCVHRDNADVSIGGRCSEGGIALRFYSDAYGSCNGENCQGAVQLPTVFQSAATTRYLECRSERWVYVCSALAGAFNSCRANDLFCSGDKFEGQDSRTVRDPYIEFGSTIAPEYTARIADGCDPYLPLGDDWTKDQIRNSEAGRAAIRRNAKLNSLLNISTDLIRIGP